MSQLMIATFLLLALTSRASGQGEYFVDLSPEARSLSSELQANARVSEKRFDGAEDVSKIHAWFIGSCHTSAQDYHLVAYFSNPGLAHVGVFHGDKRLADLWRFPFDARQFYVEGTRLMFAARPRLHEDTKETYERVTREVVLDFSALPKSRDFTFHGNVYEVAQ